MRQLLRQIDRAIRLVEPYLTIIGLALAIYALIR